MKIAGFLVLGLLVLGLVIVFGGRDPNYMTSTQRQQCADAAASADSDRLVPIFCKGQR